MDAQTNRKDNRNIKQLFYFYQVSHSHCELTVAFLLYVICFLLQSSVKRIFLAFFGFPFVISLMIYTCKAVD